MTRMEMHEIWKPVVGYEGLYEVSNLGNVRSLPKKKWNGESWYFMKGRVLKLSRHSRGYFDAVLCKSGKHKHFKVHRLVAQAFIPNPENLPCINHKNEVKTDNRVENLEWCTYKYNLEYSGNMKKRTNASVEATRKPVIQYTKDMYQQVTHNAKQEYGKAQ